MTNITKDIQIIDLALYIPKHKTVIFSDFHLGYEEMLTSRGTLVPRFQFKDTIKRLDKIFQQIQTSIKKIIINGDLKHEFGTISNQEWREILQLIDYFSKKFEEIIIVKGNHDVKLTPITRKRDVTIVDSYKMGDLLIAHGDAVEEAKGIKTIIIGHEHPAISLRDNMRVEKFKCFLKGKWRRKTLIVQPSFNVVVEGADILKEKRLSPYLQKSISNFEVYVVAEKVLCFGKVKGLR